MHGHKKMTKQNFKNLARRIDAFASLLLPIASCLQFFFMITTSIPILLVKFFYFFVLLVIY